MKAYREEDVFINSQGYIVGKDDQGAINERYRYQTELHENREKAVRRARRREKIKSFLSCLKLFAIGCIIGVIIALYEGCDGLPKIGESAQEAMVTVEEQKAVENITTPKSSMDEEAGTTSNWHKPSKTHNITKDSIIRLEGKGLYNFGDTVAAGRCVGNNVIVPSEADYGVTLKVKDKDTITITPYNNTDKNVKVLSVVAEVGSGDYKSSENREIYSVSGYATSEDGFGFVDVEFEADKTQTMSLGVFKQGDDLWVCNVASKDSFAEQHVNSRLDLETAMKEWGVTLENATSKSPIYYPIVAQEGEAYDVEPWFEKSSELVKTDWTDAHKVMIFYNYIINNIAYDQYSCDQGTTSRWFLKQDFDGSCYTSKTNVAICQDVANILAFMCREQGIPAVGVFSGEHAWSAVYIKDYDRWIQIDVTTDMKYYAYDEDVTAWTNAAIQGRETYSHYDIAMDYSTVAFIGVGNYEDMKTYNIPLY